MFLLVLTLENIVDDGNVHNSSKHLIFILTIIAKLYAECMLKDYWIANYLEEFIAESIKTFDDEKNVCNILKQLNIIRKNKWQNHKFKNFVKSVWFKW